MRWTLCFCFLLGCPEPVPVTGLPSPAPVPTSTAVPTDPTDVPTQTLRVVAYNVESGDAEPDTISANVATVTGEALWGFSECLNQSWLTAFAAAADDGGQDFQTLIGTTGFNDKLGIAYDRNVLTYESHEELHAINVDGSARAPLVATFLVNGSDVRFKFMVNHLWRSNEGARHEQGELLNDWAQTQTLPVVAVGDYNFDWAVNGGDTDHDLGYDNMVQGGVWSWVRPDDLVKTQCSGFNGVLDFVFTANGAQDWSGVGDILLRGNVHCQDNALKPDHRPVDAVFEIPLQ